MEVCPEHNTEKGTSRLVYACQGLDRGVGARLQGARENIQGPSASAERSERGAAGGQASTAGSRPGGAPTVLPAEPLTGVRRGAPTQPFKGARGRTGPGRLSTSAGLTRTPLSPRFWKTPLRLLPVWPES